MRSKFRIRHVLDAGIVDAVVCDTLFVMCYALSREKMQDSCILCVTNCDKPIVHRNALLLNLC